MANSDAGFKGSARKVFSVFLYAPVFSAGFDSAVALSAGSTDGAMLGLGVTFPSKLEAGVNPFTLPMRFFLLSERW